MSVAVEFDPPFAANSSSCQPSFLTSPLYSGSRFEGSQKSKGNCYDVEVILQVTRNSARYLTSGVLQAAVYCVTVHVAIFIAAAAVVVMLLLMVGGGGGSGGGGVLMTMHFCSTSYPVLILKGIDGTPNP